ncbi:MAG TPA: ABC transporter ATP-binding protein [Acidimicrobiales bacterium]|nr:ABC transporter ATP-binding protein [Acidimicrobiales bacterium]
MSRLEVANVEVRFGGVAALRGVDLTADAGTVTGLIGPNGAGKTTLFNVVTGLCRADSGSVLLDSEPIGALPPHKRARLGIARTFQRLEIFGSLTVRENILVAAEIRRRWSRDGSRPRDVADEIMSEVGLDGVATVRCDTLPTGMARLVEVGRALATRPRVLLLDEPSSGLDEGETDELGLLLQKMAERGVAVLLVEHDVELVMSVCRLVHVLDFGRVLSVGTPAEVQADPEVRAAYLGTEEPDEPGLRAEVADALA